MNETTENQGKPESGKACMCENPMQCLEKAMHENPTRAMWWCLGIGFLVGWKLKSCLHSMIPRRS
jgi:hypothetical protein